ncbi:YceI family protein [Acidobacteria bacterium AB60]|nr:YceI family protein [Acidobacteria bacterium AB60]
MKSSVLALGLISLAAPLVGAQTSTWAIDPAHSEVDFVVRHMGVSNVHGRFGGVKGNITLDETDAAKSTVSVTIDVNTLDTGVSPRDTDLKSPNWFDVAKFPTATFESTSVTVAGGHMKVDGNLTLHGIKRPVELDVEGPSPTIPGMDHKPHSGYSATTTLKRKDFGVGANAPDAVVGNDIKLTIDLEVVKQ